MGFLTEDLIEKEDFLYKRYSINLFGEKINTYIFTSAMDISEITKYQETTFNKFQENEKKIISALESTVIDYCQSEYGYSDKEDFLKQVHLQSITLPPISEDNKRYIGFIFDTDFDIELGIGVQFLNEELQKFGTQHVAC